MVNFKFFSSSSNNDSLRATPPPPPLIRTSPTKEKRTTTHQRKISFRSLFKPTSLISTTTTTTEQQQQQLPETPNDDNKLEIINSPTTPFNTRRSQEQTKLNSTSPSPIPPLRHKSSLVSLVESFKSNSKLSFTNSTNNNNNNTFALKSFRNVRENQPEPEPTTNNNISSRPPSITSISRPSSPSSKISAAAFREARAARNSRASVSSSFSDLNHHHLNQLHSKEQPPTTKHARFKSSPGKALSDYGQPPSARPAGYSDHHQQHHSLRPLSQQQQRLSTYGGLHPLITQIPPRHPVSTALNQPMPSSPFQPHNANPLYSEHDILMPPRPAFYGSRMSTYQSPGPSSRSDYGALSSSAQNRFSVANGLYANPYGNMSNSSIRSAPSNPVIRLETSRPSHNRGRSVTAVPTTNRQSFHPDSRQLDQWHSDEEDEPGTANRPRPHGGRKQEEEEDEDDSVPLSKLKKKSVGSLRDAALTAAAAQTLARTRQQLHHNSANAIFLPASQTNPLHYQLPEDRGKSNLQHQWNSRLSHIPPVPTIRPEISLKGVMHHHARGNSPASSSSGSGSGTWSIPITPRDSMPASHSLHLLPPTLGLPPNRNLPRSRVTFAAPASGSGSASLSDKDSSVGAGSAHRLSSIKNVDAVGSTATNKSANQEDVSGDGGHWAGVRVEELGVPAGVDAYLYAGLGPEQKMQLHQRSQMMMQMMAAQAQAAVQMHALALASSNAPLMAFNHPAEIPGLRPPVPGFQGWPAPPPVPSSSSSSAAAAADNNPPLIFLDPTLIPPAPHASSPAP